MKYVIIRCEDGAPARQQTTALLESARVTHLQQLAQTGAAGLIRGRADTKTFNRFAVHCGLLGVGQDAPAAHAGLSYAASLHHPLAEGDTAWCCDFVTQRDGQLIDATAGAISTKESSALVQHLNKQLGSETLRWVVGSNAQHLLVMRTSGHDPLELADLPSPEQLLDQPWRQQLPQGALGKQLSALLEAGERALEEHPINRVRIDLGENPANMFWLSGAARPGTQQTFLEHTGHSGAMATNSFSLRGLAELLQLTWTEGPTVLEEAPLRRLAVRAQSLISQHDITYLHLFVASGDPVQRLCAMERIDQLLLKPLTEQLPEQGPWRLLIVVDDRGSSALPFVALGTGLPQQPVLHLTTQGFAESPFVLPQGTAPFAWLMKDA